MANNKSNVEDLLVQFFGTELNTTAPVNVINVTEEWLNSNKPLQVLFENYAPDGSTSTSATTTTNISTTFQNENAGEENQILIKSNYEEYDAGNINDSEFELLFRMKRSTVLDLVNEINNSKDSETEIDIDINLLICLWILGNTKTFSELSILFNIKQEDLFDLCEKYMDLIVKLSPKYIQWPTDTEFLSIETGFLNEYKFPGIAGIISCIHLAVYLEKNNPKAFKYFNKNTGNYTIVLQAVCDNNLLFRDVFVGYPGSNSIETILKASSLYGILTDENSILRKTKRHLLGGTEHPQMPTLLTPYSHKEGEKLTEKQENFNALHGSVIYTVEKTFKMVETRFPRMKSLETTSPHFASLAAGAICTLHNFCRLRNDELFSS